MKLFPPSERDATQKRGGSNGAHTGRAGGPKQQKGAMGGGAAGRTVLPTRRAE